MFLKKEIKVILNKIFFKLFQIDNDWLMCEEARIRNQIGGHFRIRIQILYNVFGSPTQLK